VGQVTVVTVADGSLIDAQHIDNIRETLIELIAKQDRKRVALVMSRVHHFSSSALGMLMQVAGEARRAKGKLVLCAVRPEVRKVFKITKLEKQFKFADSEAGALKVLG
jgi:anti-sigma B factor antagonist